MATSEEIGLLRNAVNVLARDKKVSEHTARLMHGMIGGLEEVDDEVYPRLSYNQINPVFRGMACAALFKYDPNPPPNQNYEDTDAPARLFEKLTLNSYKLLRVLSDAFMVIADKEMMTFTGKQQFQMGLDYWHTRVEKGPKRYKPFGGALEHVYFNASRGYDEDRCDLLAAAAISGPACLLLFDPVTDSLYFA